jgi:ABC-type multidrug transport system permease subunit
LVSLDKLHRVGLLLKLPLVYSADYVTSPIGYAFESLMINEFRNRRFPCVTYVPAGNGYEDVSGLQRTCTAVGKRVGSEFVEGNDYLKTAFNYEESHLWRYLLSASAVKLNADI